jgi:hypothetical protein
MQLSPSSNIYRVIDANLNRLREGVRVVEECFRFILDDTEKALRLKDIRHKVRNVEEGIDRNSLLSARDSVNDPFAKGVVAKEGERESLEELVLANIRRAQEAARVLEEYLKLVDAAPQSELSKQIRFALYTIEKEWVIDV